MAAAILGGVDDIWIVSFDSRFSSILFCLLSMILSLQSLCFCMSMKKPGARVLYLGAASGTTVSHVSDIVGPVSVIFNTAVLKLVKLIIDSYNCCCFCRLELFMQWSFLIEVAETW